jgi:hypothetical protein
MRYCTCCTPTRSVIHAEPIAIADGGVWSTEFVGMPCFGGRRVQLPSKTDKAIARIMFIKHLGKRHKNIRPHRIGVDSAMLRTAQ